MCVMERDYFMEFICRLCASSGNFYKCFCLVLPTLHLFYVAECHANWSRICPVSTQLKSSSVKVKLRDQVVTNVKVCNDP
jgi:hypothetical protein